MATLNYVNRKIEQVILAWGLTVNSSEEEIRQALEEARRYGEPYRFGRPIFPANVMRPADSHWDSERSDTVVDRWEIDHKWGEGPNESLGKLVHLTIERLMKDTGVDERRWVPEDLRKYGVTTLRRIDETLKTTESQRGPGSPYTQNYWKEARVALRIGTSLLMYLYQQVHWKSWSDVVNFMYDHEDFEELGPWYFVFGKKGHYGEQGEWIEEQALKPNRDCLDAVREFSWLISHAEMARVVSTLARFPQPITLAKIVRWTTGHKGWQEEKLEGERGDWAETLIGMLKSADLRELQELTRQSDFKEVSFLHTLGRVLFQVASEEDRQQFVEAAGKAGLVAAVKMYGILQGITYFHAHAQLVKKLGSKVPLAYITTVFPPKPTSMFETLVDWYETQEEQPASFPMFARAAVRCHGGDTWEQYLRFESVLGADRAWDAIIGMEYNDVATSIAAGAAAAEMGPDLVQFMDDEVFAKMNRPMNTSSSDWQKVVEGVRKVGYDITREIWRRLNRQPTDGYDLIPTFLDASSKLGAQAIRFLPEPEDCGTDRYHFDVGNYQLREIFCKRIKALNVYFMPDRFADEQEFARASMYDSWSAELQPGFFVLEKVLGEEGAWQLLESTEDGVWGGSRAVVLKAVQGLEFLTASELQHFLGEKAIIVAVGSVDRQRTIAFARSLRRVGFGDGIELFRDLNRYGKSASEVFEAHCAVTEKGLLVEFDNWLPAITPTPTATPIGEPDEIDYLAPVTQQEAVRIINLLFTAVKAYRPQTDDRFENRDGFIRRGLYDGWGEQVRGWYGQLVAMVGEDLTWEYVLRANDTGGHDAFFFVPRLLEKLDAYSVRRIIEQADDIRLLAQCVDAYAPDGTRFDGWRQFVKHTNLQRYHITIPGDDQKVKAAVAVMLEAPGLSVDALRKELQTSRFLALARGEMDAKALLQPQVRFYYLTPTKELVRLALGTAGNVEDYQGLRQKLVELANRSYKAAMREFQRTRSGGDKSVVKPETHDLMVVVPDELSAPVAELLREYGVEIRKFPNLAAAVRWGVGTLPQSEATQKLYGKLNHLARQNGVKGVDDLLKSVPVAIEEAVLCLLEEHKVPMGPAYKIEILAKSDPRGWVGGNWTVCCASFGQSKNWDYMYKRSFAYMIVSLVKSTDEERMIAWSVVDATIRVGKKISAETAMEADVDAWTMDNIEGNKNYAEHFKAVEAVMPRFWRAVTTKRVMVGAWYNDLVPSGAVHLKDSGEVRAKWQPLEEMEYTDFFRASECQTWLVQEGSDAKAKAD